MTERHDHSVETAWKAMLDLEKRFDWLFLWDLQPIEELKRLKTREGDLAGTYELIADSYGSEGLMNQPVDDSVDRVRPFLGETLYDIFAIHRLVIYISALALHGVACEQSDMHWSTAQSLRDALDSIDVGNQPKIGEVLATLKSRFCEVHAGTAVHKPSGKSKTIGFQAGLESN